MKQAPTARQTGRNATDRTKGESGQGQKRPWQTPQLLAADYDITAKGVIQGGDFYTLS